MAVETTHDLFGAGNALLDISSVVPAEFLDKYELKGGNAILAEDKHLPIYKELSEMEKVKYIPGGACMNSMRICSWILGGKDRVTYTSCIGKDEYAEKLTSQCAADGIKASFERSEKATGTCAVCIVDKERSMVANLSAANEYSLKHLQSESCKALWQSAKIVYISGFWLTVCPEGMVEIGKHCKANNKPFCLNISAPFLPAFFKQQLLDVLPYVTILFGNDDEFKAMAKSLELGTEKVAEIGAKLVNQSCETGRMCICTQGKESTMVFMPNNEIKTFDVKVLNQELIVDLNVAGDAFVGGFLSQLVQGKELKRCVDVGNAASRAIIQVSGCDLDGITFQDPDC